MSSSTASTPSSSSSSIISTSSSPITILGVTGNTGGYTVTSLLSRNDNTIHIRGVVRSEEKGQEWLKKLSTQYGAERISKHVTFVVVAIDTDTSALVKAFTGSSAVYFMLAPQLPSDRTYTQAKQRVAAGVEALKQSHVNRIVVLSGIGAHHSHGLGVAQQLYFLEQSLITAFITTTATATASSTTTTTTITTTPSPYVTLTFIRGAIFFENSTNDIPAVKSTGHWTAFYNPQVHASYVATKDVGTESARHLVDREDRRNNNKTTTNHIDNDGTQNKNPLFIELEAPTQYGTTDFADVYSKVFGRTVAPNLIPRSEWNTKLASFGIPNFLTWSLEELYDSVNSGHLQFENKPENGTVSVKGTTTLEEGLGEMIAKFEASQQQQQAK